MAAAVGAGRSTTATLSAIGEAAFIAEVVNAEVRFERHGVGAADQLIVRQRGEELRFARAE
jgi:hypothetical protein